MTSNLRKESLLTKALTKHGIPCPPRDIKAKGFTRWGKNNRYWIVPIVDGYIFGDFVEGISEIIFDKSSDRLSKRDWIQRKLEIKKANKELMAIQEIEWDKAAAKARELYSQASPVKIEDVLYLRGRGHLIIPNWLRLDRYANLIVPFYNSKFELRTIQTISPKGEKRFLFGGQKKGNFSFIGSLPNENLGINLIYIVEGFCTGGSVFTVLHLHGMEACVIVAGDAGNLKPVSIEIKMLYPNATIIIAGDNDQSREDVNIGLVKANEASEAIGGVPVVVPRFSNPDDKRSDWNDLHCRYRIEEVYARLVRANPVNKNKDRTVEPAPFIKISS